MDKLLLRLRHLFLWAMLFAVGVVSPPAFACDEHRQATVTYDAPSLVVLDYDVALVSSAHRSENQTGNGGGIFAHLAQFLAAKSSPTPRLPGATADPLN